MSTLEVNTIDSVSGTSNLTIGSGNSSQITLKSGATLTNFPANTPAFEAYMSANLSITNSTDTVVTFNTENFDTDSAYDTSNYRFTPQVAGKYFFYVTLNIDDGNATAMQWLGFGKNGTFGTTGLGGSNRRTWSTAGNSYVTASTHITLNGSTDYVQAYVRHENSVDCYAQSGSRVWSIFGGYKLIGA